MFGFVKTSLWEQIDADAREAFDELVEHLGDRVEEVELVTPADDVLEWQRAIGGAEIAINLRREWENGRDRLSAALRARIEHGRAVARLDYLSALGRVPQLNASLTELFRAAVRRDPDACRVSAPRPRGWNRPATRPSARCGRSAACRR